MASRAAPAPSTRERFDPRAGRVGQRDALARPLAGVASARRRTSPRRRPRGVGLPEAADAQRPLVQRAAASSAAAHAGDEDGGHERLPRASPERPASAVSDGGRPALPPGSPGAAPASSAWWSAHSSSRNRRPKSCSRSIRMRRFVSAPVGPAAAAAALQRAGASAPRAPRPRTPSRARAPRPTARSGRCSASSRASAAGSAARAAA